MLGSTRSMLGAKYRASGGGGDVVAFSDSFDNSSPEIDLSGQGWGKKLDEPWTSEGFSNFTRSAGKLINPMTLKGQRAWGTHLLDSSKIIKQEITIRTDPAGDLTFSIGVAISENIDVRSLRDPETKSPPVLGVGCIETGWFISLNGIGATSTGINVTPSGHSLGDTVQITLIVDAGSWDVTVYDVDTGTTATESGTLTMTPEYAGLSMGGDQLGAWYDNYSVTYVGAA